MKSRLIAELLNASPAQIDDSAFITLDVDWAPDFVLEKVITLVEDAGVRATWFITHETPLLERLRTNALFEVGIHPNFNLLLNGQVSPLGLSDFRQVIDYFCDLVPEAISMRSHSLVQAPMIFSHCLKRGIKIDSSSFVPASSNPLELHLMSDFSGMKRAPFFWGDYAAISTKEANKPERLLSRAALKIFNFHPIHLYFNSNTLAVYEHSKTLPKEEREYHPLINSSFGVRNHFDSLVNELVNRTDNAD